MLAWKWIVTCRYTWSALNPSRQGDLIDTARASAETDLLASRINIPVLPCVYCVSVCGWAGLLELIFHQQPTSAAAEELSHLKHVCWSGGTLPAVWFQAGCLLGKSEGVLPQCVSHLTVSSTFPPSPFNTLFNMHSLLVSSCPPLLCKYDAFSCQNVIPVCFNLCNRILQLDYSGLFHFSVFSNAFPLSHSMCSSLSQWMVVFLIFSVLSTNRTTISVNFLFFTLL